MLTVEKRLSAVGVVLPPPRPPAANYVPFMRSGNLVFIAGQVSMDAAGGGFQGIVGVDLDLATAQLAARLCGVNLISQMREACLGDLGRVRRVVKLGGFVQAGPAFSDIALVVNGASDLMVEAFGEAGRHARSSVGVYRLPRNVAVEIDAIVEVA
jgi:enamine deaminase RidA (YjgF/YER057c/UK114 family)